MAKKKVKPELPSDEYVLQNKSKLAIELDKLSSNNYPTKRPTVTAKLELVRDLLEPLKDKKIPYTTLKEVIKDNVGIEVGVQTLRMYCQEKLNFEKKERKNSNNTISSTTQNDSESNSY